LIVVRGAVGVDVLGGLTVVGAEVGANDVVVKTVAGVPGDESGSEG
jgi:hypothetical protein